MDINVGDSIMAHLVSRGRREPRADPGSLAITPARIESWVRSVFWRKRDRRL